MTINSKDLSIRLAISEDVDAIVAIYNEAVRDTTSTFDTEPKTVEQQLEWLKAHDARHPVIVAVIEQQVIGWGALSKWSDRPAYNQTGETSSYVSQKFRGRGVGRALKRTLIKDAKRLGYHTLLARVAEGNEASMYLNESLDFELIGTMKQVGLKFGKRLDVHLMQLMLE